MNALERKKRDQDHYQTYRDYQLEWHKNRTARLTKDELEERSKRLRAYHQANKNKIKERNRLTTFTKKYGMSESAYRKIVKEQKNKCKVCSANDPTKLDTTKSKHPVLLCGPCNIQAQNMRKKLPQVKRILAYIES